MTGLGGLIAGRTEPGVYRWRSTARSADVIALAEAANWRAMALDGSAIHDKASLLDAFAAGFSFPDWFGRNWDALADCLGDLSWLGESSGYLVLFEDWPVLAGADADAFATTLDILRTTSDIWRSRKEPFAVLLRPWMSLPELPLLG